jgi:hypothetical protein
MWVVLVNNDQTIPIQLGRDMEEEEREDGEYLVVDIGEELFAEIQKISYHIEIIANAFQDFKELLQGGE